MSKYLCMKKCYPYHLCEVGDVVDEEVAKLVPTCFHKLASTRPSAIRDEINDLLYGGMEPESDELKVLTNKELNRKVLPPLNGEPKRRTRGA